jgi:two-component system response regulator FlrC
MRKRVVIVEPHDDSRTLYADYFAAAGFDIVPVAGGVEAVRAIRHAAPDALVTCLRLTDMDAFELCEVAASLAGVPPAVVGLSTSHADHDRAVNHPALAVVLMKPFQPDVLLQSVRRTLNRPPVAAASAARRPRP